MTRPIPRPAVVTEDACRSCEGRFVSVQSRPAKSSSAYMQDNAGQRRFKFHQRRVAPKSTNVSKTVMPTSHRPRNGADSPFQFQGRGRGGYIQPSRSYAFW